jgi:hypothetical protein
LARKFGNQALTKGYALEDEETASLVKNAGSRLDNMQIKGMPLSQPQMMQLATMGKITDDGTKDGRTLLSADTYMKRASIQKAAKIATVSEAEDLINASMEMTSAGERKTVVDSLAGSGALSKATYLGGKTLGYSTAGTNSASEIAKDPGIGKLGLKAHKIAALEALYDGKITAETLANGDAKSVRTLVNAVAAAKDTEVGKKARAQLEAAYKQFSSADSARLREKVTAGSDHDKFIQKISKLDTYIPSDTP